MKASGVLYPGDLQMDTQHTGAQSWLRKEGCSKVGDLEEGSGFQEEMINAVK